MSLTHVCRSWRAVFTSHPSLWTRLDCEDVHKTLVYVERSKSLPLEVTLTESGNISYHGDALLAAASQIDRIGSLVVYRYSRGLQDLLERFPLPAAALKELKIVLGGVSASDAVIPGETFPRDPSSIRRLSLSGVVTSLPWRNLSNLTEFEFCYHPRSTGSPSAAELLDFLESAPLLRRVSLGKLLPADVVALPDRTVSLQNLERLTMDELPEDSTFLDHLSIPPGACLDLRFEFSGLHGPQVPFCLNDGYFGNLSRITEVNLLLNVPFWARARLAGPSGELRMDGRQVGESYPILLSLCEFNLAEVETLSVTGCPPSRHGDIEGSSAFELIPLTDNLRTLALIGVDHRWFVQALTPRGNGTGAVVCPRLEELALYFERWERADTRRLAEMAKGRAKNGSELSFVRMVRWGGHLLRLEVPSVKKYVSRVECVAEDSPPGWDTVFGGEGDGGYDSEWDAFPDEVGRGDDESGDEPPTDSE